MNLSDVLMDALNLSGNATERGMIPESYARATPKPRPAFPNNHIQFLTLKTFP